MLVHVRSSGMPIVLFFRSLPLKSGVRLHVYDSAIHEMVTTGAEQCYYGTP